MHRHAQTTTRGKAKQAIRQARANLIPRHALTSDTLSTLHEEIAMLHSLSSSLARPLLRFLFVWYPPFSLHLLLLQYFNPGLSDVPLLPYHVELSVVPQMQHGPPGFGTGAAPESVELPETCSSCS